MKTVIGLLIGGQCVSPLAFFVSLGYWEPSISAIDAATAGVLSFSMLLYAVVIFDQIVETDWKAFGVDVHERLDRYTIRAGYEARLPIIASVVKYLSGARIGALGDVNDSQSHEHPYIRSYKDIRSAWWGLNIELYRTILSRLPLFLLAGTSIARFVLGEPIIPLTG